MKSIYIFCTNLLVYLTEIPVIALLVISIAYNGKSDDFLKFYPLIVLLAATVIFIFIYFFRTISINTDEIRYHGIFSSKDSAFITANKTLTVSLFGICGMRLELFGDASEEPPFEWMKAEDISHRDISLFRGRAVGGKRSAFKILSYFALEKEKLEGFENEGFSYEDERISINTYRENEVLKFDIKFKITII